MDFGTLKIAFFRRVYGLLHKRQFGRLGKKSVILKPLLISGKKNIYIGTCVTVRNNGRIETIGAWNKEKFSPELIIDDNTMIEQGVHITCANKVHIHKNVLIAPYVYITDCMHSYDDVIIPVIKQTLQVKQTEIGENCWIGIGAKILAGVHIGKNCVVGANSVVTKDIPDYCVVAGTPAKIVKRYNFEKKVWEKS